MIEEQVRRTVEAEGMLRPGDRVLCAVSGGADSVALLLLMQELAQAWSITLCAAHFNHQLRGAEAQRDADFVQALCQKQGIPCAMGMGDVAAYSREKHISLETAAREMRYAFLQQTAKECGADRIATAHHAGDQLETMLYHLARGSGPDGLRGIPPVRGNIIRPLLEISKAEILAYLAEKRQDFVTDSTNEVDDCARNRIRHLAVPVLQEINAGADVHAAQCARLLREELAELEVQAAGWTEKLAKITPSYVLISGGFWQLSPVMARRVLRRILRLHFDLTPEEKHIAAVLALGEKESAAVCHLPKRMQAQRVYDGLRLFRQEEEKPEDQPLSIPETGLVFGDYQVKAEITTHKPQVNNLFNIFYLDCAKIDFNTLCIRTRQPGDRLQLAGHSGHKTLKKWYGEKKIPVYLRDRLPVIADQNGVICVPDLGQAAERTGKSREFLKIEFHKL
jgi:tRNA(Ile)-lysidine synthetase-like protein